MDYVSSLEISKITEKSHNHVLAEIRHRFCLSDIRQSTRLNSQNRRFPVYFLTQKQYLELIMLFVPNLSKKSKKIAKLQHKTIVDNYAMSENMEFGKQ